MFRLTTPWRRELLPKPKFSRLTPLSPLRLLGNSSLYSTRVTRDSNNEVLHEVLDIIWLHHSLDHELFGPIRHLM